jgi:hypothetical protein
LGGAPTIWAECVFVDPIRDVAVLQAPDGQAGLYNECLAYERFVEDRPTLRLAAIMRQARAWLLTLDERWEECTVQVGGGGRMVTLVNVNFVGGMSGSPIVIGVGRVVGIASVGSESAGRVQPREQHGQPSLVATLPGWLLAELIPSVGRWPIMIASQKRGWDQYLRAVSKLRKSKRVGEKGDERVRTESKG